MRGVRLFISVVLLLAVLGGLEAQSPSTVMVEAKIAYEAGNYAEAIALYEGLVTDGYCEPALFYNLGNAYYESGQLGGALVNYRRAAQLTPRDTFVSRAIARVVGERIDVLVEDQHPLVFIANSFSWISLGESEVILFGLWGAFCISAGGAIALKTRRSVLLRIGALLGIALLLLTGNYGIRRYLLEQMPGGVVIAPQAAIYSGPAETYLEIYVLFDGADIRLLERDGDWMRFRLSDGRQGWMRYEDVALYEPVCAT